MLLFSTDIDGTIYDGPESAEWFAKFWSDLRTPEDGPLLVYNTGRLLRDTLQLIQDTALPLPDYLITGVGTEIYHCPSQTVVSEWGEELSVLWDFDRVKRLTSAHCSRLEYQPEEHQNAHKCSWFWHDRDDHEIDTLASKLNGEGLRTQVVYSSRRDLDVLPLKANKGNAVRWLAERIGIPASRVMVAGDSGNDASMFLVEGVSGIVVANAEPSLLAALSGRDVYRASLPCAAGVVEGLRHHLDRSAAGAVTPAPTPLKR